MNSPTRDSRNSSCTSMESIVLSVIPDIDFKIDCFAEQKYKIIGPEHVINKLVSADNGFNGSNLSILEGVLSPIWPVALKGKDKIEAGIPENATKFTFLQPIESLVLSEIKPWIEPWAFVLMVGGFVYFDENGKVLSVNAISYAKPLPSQPSRVMVGPFEPTEEAFEALRESNRLQPIVFPDMVEAGFVAKCWVNPGETFGSGSSPISVNDQNKFGCMVFERSSGRAVVYAIKPNTDPGKFPPVLDSFDGDPTSLGAALCDIRKRSEEAAFITEQAGEIITAPALQKMDSVQDMKEGMINFEMIKYFTLRILIVAAYITLGGLYYVNITRERTWVESVYFAVVTMSTVGYGDYYPVSAESRWFTGIYIIFGIAVVFNILGEAYEVIVGILETKIKKLLCCGKKASDNAQMSHYERDAKMRGWKFYLRELAFYSIVGFLINLPFCAWIFTIVEPGTDYATAMWFCWVTATTVGYGDVLPTNPTAQAWVCVNIILSVSWLSGLLRRIDQAKQKRAYLLARKRMMRNQLDEKLIDQLDRKKSGRVNKVEFVVGMLINMGAQIVGTDVDWEDHVKPLILRFEALDADGNGFLEPEDLEFMINEAKKNADAETVGEDEIEVTEKDVEVAV